MPGTVVRVVPKQNPTLVSSVVYILAKAVDVSGYREGTLLFRAHHTGDTISSGTITITVYREAPTADDPAGDFVEGGGTTLGTGTINTFTLPQLVAIPLAANMGGWIRITLTTAASTSGVFNFSADLSLKS